MRKKNNRKYLLTGLLVVLLAFLLIGVLFYVNNRTNSYSFQEKSWINNNVDKIINKKYISINVLVLIFDLVFKI